jgi:hypothetical protein
LSDIRGFSARLDQFAMEFVSRVESLYS